MVHIRTNGRRFLAFLLSMLILLSALPTLTYAEEGSIADPEIPYETDLAADVEALEETETDALDVIEPHGEVEEPIEEQPSEEPLDEITEESPLPEIEWVEEAPAPEQEEEESELPVDDIISLKDIINEHGYTYVTTKSAASLYNTPQLAEHEQIYAITHAGAVLLATEYIEWEYGNSLKVWLISEVFEVVSGYEVLSDFEIISGYISVDTLTDTTLSDEEAFELFEYLMVSAIPTEKGEIHAFVVSGHRTNTVAEAPIYEEPSEPEANDTPEHEEVLPEPQQEIPEEPQEEPIVQIDDNPIPDMSPFLVGDFVAITTSTRVFIAIDDTASEEYAGDLCLGVFVKDAIVQIESIEQDSYGRTWFNVRYMFGDDYADGSLKWADYSTIYVLADETEETTQQDFTVTDYAFSSVPVDLQRGLMRLAASPMNGFSLKSINAPIGTFSVGQNNVHGSSGKDSDYKQIATVAGHGTVYATPHYLDGFTVYCLEHNLPGPGERKSGGGQQPTGPYLIVDIDTYMNTPGNSQVIYKASTLHAIAWVLRHSYPFMVLDRTDSDNESWSRVAGQFAIREVIKQMEGSQYVRDYWNMDNFYVASGQAPSVYLAYARWLASNGIARGNITGNITFSNQSVTSANGLFIGTVTLTTDADLMRISKSSGSVTGHTAGEDGSYYYATSGNTITVTSPTNGFTVNVDSINSDSEEASFLVGVPSADIQKVLIPQYGAPYELKSASITFEEVILYGDLEITKRRDRGDLRVLPNAQFQLYDSDRVAYGKPVTTDANGKAKWTQLRYGTFYLQELSAPTGYQVAINQQRVEIKESNTTLTISNTPIIGSIRFIKKASHKNIPLVGAKYGLYTKVSDGYEPAVSIVDGNPLPALTTDTNGEATWQNVVEQGEYYVHEIEAPEGFQLDPAYHRIDMKAQATIEVANVTDDPITGQIRIVKKDELTKEPLAGATFTVTRLSAPASYNNAGVGEIVATITTNANGIAMTDWLEWGKYRIEETIVPEHFVDNHFSVDIEMYEHGKTYTIDVENEPAKGWIRLTKTDRQNGNPVEGVQFDIFYNDEYGSGLAGTMITSKEGIAISEPLRKGRYLVKECGETAGYVFEEIILDATIKSDKTTELEVTNRHVTVKLKLYKRDAEEYEGDTPNATAKAKQTKAVPEPANIGAPETRGDGVLTGAEFQVVAAEDIKDRQGNIIYLKGTMVVESLKTTGTDASVIIDELWPALYEIIELTPPTGYQPATKSIYVDARSAATQSTEAIITYEGLVTNKIKYGVYAFVKFLGDNEIHDDAGIIETPEKDAEFRIYLKRAGSYENARAFERDYLTTNKHGYVKTKPLPYGLYVVEQVKGKEGYAIKSPFEIFIFGTEDPQDPPIIIINNEAIRYRLKFIKVDAETGNTIALANTAFKLKDSDGNYVKQTFHYPNPSTVDTFYTDESGEVTLPETVTRGMYFVEEVVSPDSYLILADDFGVYVGSDDMNQPGEAYQLEIKIPNDPVKGRIILDKKGLQLIGFEALTDDYGNEYQKPVYKERYLKGAVFEMRAAEDIIGKDRTVWFTENELVDTITTTGSGADASKVLPLGKYYLIETETPEGFIASDARSEVNLLFQDNLTALVETTVSIGNDYMPIEIKLTKEKEITQVKTNTDGTIQQVIEKAHGEAVVFGLFNDTDIRYDSGTLMADTLMATGVTNAEGVLTFSGLYPHGSYYVKELSSLLGWKLNPEQFEIHLAPNAAGKDDGVIRAALPQEICNELIYTNITLTKTDITGQNTLPGALIEVTNSNGKAIYRAYTDKDGHIPDIPVTPGTYTFREVLAPSGFALNEAVMTFTVDEDGNITGDKIIRDDYNRFSILKHDENGQPLAGVEFRLRKDDWSKLFVATTDTNGVATFESIPHGNYTIEESKPLVGYVKSDVRIPITIDGTFINPSEPLTTIVNYQKRIRFIKVDTSGAFLPDVEFSLINASTNQIAEVVTSNEKGEFAFTKFDNGDWIVRETKIPDGFNKMPDYKFTVDDRWKEPAPITFVNIPNHYEFVKVDNEGNPMAGVKFTLEDANGNTLRDMVSDENGIVHVTDLPCGVYTIREIETKEGFTLTEETIQVTIDEKYIVPTEMLRLVNYPNIQTGVDFTITPIMVIGAVFVFAGAALIIIQGVKPKKKKHRK